MLICYQNWIAFTWDAQRNTGMKLQNWWPRCLTYHDKQSLNQRTDREPKQLPSTKRTWERILGTTDWWVWDPSQLYGRIYNKLRSPNAWIKVFNLERVSMPSVKDNHALPTFWVSVRISVKKKKRIKRI